MTVRYIYLDQSQLNDGYFSEPEHDDPGVVWLINTDAMFNIVPMDLAGISGSTSAAAYVDNGIPAPDDVDYWYTQVVASGFAKLPTEPLLIMPDRMTFMIRNWPDGSGVIIQDIQVVYKSGLNPGFGMTKDYVVASGFWNKYHFPSQVTWVDTELELTINTAQSGEFAFLISSGIPRLQFYYSNDLNTSTFKSISEINLWASGYSPPNPPVTSNITLYITGPNYSSGELPLYMFSNDFGSGNIPLYVQGALLNSGNIPLFIPGWDTYSGVLPLYTQCANLTTSGISFYMYSNDFQSGVLPLFASGPFGPYDSGNLDLFLFATTNSGLYNYIPLVLGTSGIDPSYLMDLYIGGFANPVLHSGVMNLVLSSTPRISGSLDLILYNNYTAYSGVFHLAISGGGLNADSLEGSVPYSGTMPLYMSRDFDGVWLTLPLFASAPELNSGVIPFYILGGPSLTSNIDLYISGIDPKLNAIHLFTKGI